MAGEESGWQTVRPKRAAGRPARGLEWQQSPAQPAAPAGQGGNSAAERHRVKQRILESMEELMSSELLDSCRKIVQKCFNKYVESVLTSESDVSCENSHESTNHEQSHVKQQVIHPATAGSRETHETVTATCVCYGIGNFSACVTSRYQLALLLLLLKELQIPGEQCRIFDPLFTELEIAVLKELGLTVLSENEEGKHRVHDPTLFYMVHCGKALYNNLLWRNWSAETLAKVIIIGNSFQGIEERLLTRILQRDYTYIAKILKLTEEVPLPSSTRYQDIFNDTSVHWFHYEKLSEIPSVFWESTAEPLYEDCEDLEIIRRSKK